MNAHLEAMLNERDMLRTRLETAQVSCASFLEYRIIQRELEHAESKLKMFEAMRGVLDAPN